MKKTAVFFPFLLIIVIAGIALLVINKPKNTTSGQITKGMVLGSYYQMKTPGAKVEIGNKDQVVMTPTVKITHNTNNAVLGITYPTERTPTPQTADNQITWPSQNQEVYFKKITDSKVLMNKYDEKYEFDITLKDKPISNIFTYAIDTNNLDFVYQPVVKATSVTKTINGKNKVIKTVSSIPENIQGSYSVYKSSGKTAAKGNYHTQKAFQIYRPKIIDNNNKWVWGDLNVDTKTNKLTVTVDPDFLETAKYPVIVDPTIGINYDSLHAVVTAVGRFRWKLTVEYEIQDDSGKVLGSDVLITQINPNETPDQLFGFLDNYLSQRAAVWTLAQGNYTLKEMSQDRLNAPHFQKSDSGDDISDEYASARNSRKQLIESVTPQDLPKYSVTYDEADLLQKPLQIEYAGKGKNRVPTGNIIRGNETFKLTNEAIGAGTEVLRSDGNGDASSTYVFANTGTKWGAIDDLTADDFSTYLYSNYTYTYEYYYATLSNTGLSSETITSIDLFSRGIVNDAGCPDFTPVWGHGLHITGQSDVQESIVTGGWSDKLYSSIGKPGGGGWAVSDLNNLQYKAIVSYASDGMCGEDTWSWNSDGDLTQGYVTIDFTATDTPEKAKIQGGIKFRGGAKIR